MSTPILITIPKYIKVPKQNLLPLPSLDSSVEEFLSPGKKRRLDHLTWEEKFQRKKLKNRVAAQTSRDRKKAKMDDMERTIREIADENTTLKETCSLLQSERDKLAGRNEELERQMEELKQRLNERSVGCGTTTNGSAESKPLLQELDSQSILRTINKSENTNGSVLWKIIALCLLYRTCSKTSMHPDWKNLQKACSQMSSQTWQTILLETARQMPKQSAQQSECLDQWWGPDQKSWNPPKISMTV